MNKRKGFAPIILVIIVGIVLAAGGLGLGLAWKAGLFGKKAADQTTNGTQPTPPQPPPSNGEEQPPPPEDPTKDWKTYTSEKYGYSIKYPPDWIFQIGNPGDPSAPVDEIVLRKEGVAGLEIPVEDSQGLDAKDFAERVIRRYTDASIDYEDATLGNLEGVRASYIQGGAGPDYPDGKFIYEVFIRNGRAYYFVYSISIDRSSKQPWSEKDINELGIIWDIISTFRFLD